MAKYTIQRILAMLLTMFIILTVGFMVIRLMPGGIFDDAVDMTHEQRAALEAKYNLDKPIIVQYGLFLKGLILEGDWGTSLKMNINVPVWDIIKTKIPVTLYINFFSLLIAFISVICNVCIGIVYGSIAGYYGGKVDMIMMRITEIIGAFPEIVVVTLFILFFGTGILSIILCLVVQNWIGTARMIRSQFYRYKGSEYVLAARTLGVRDMALIFRHILPNSIGPIITRAMIAIPGAIFTESFLAYIGLGIRAPESSIGVLLSQGQKVMQQYPNQVFFPAVVISLLMIAFNMLSNGLRDAFDPTQRGA